MIPGSKPLNRILAIGAHADDIEIGCGGTLLKLMGELPTFPEIRWAVFSGDPVRKQEARSSAMRYLHDASDSIHLLDFRDGYFPDQWAAIKTEMHRIGQEFQPDLILTHRLEDRHQDHRTLAELTWNVFRQHLILEYEIPKYEGDLGNNNFYCSVPESIASTKVNWLLEDFASQSGKHWFDKELFLGLMRIRGAESPESTRYAEAFYCRKFAF